MAFVLTPVRDLARARGIKVLVHGPPGVGKTVLCTTAGPQDRIAMISAEGGLLSIRNSNLIGSEIRTFAEFEESYRFFAYDTGALEWFHTICLDSISEIAEICLVSELASAKDPRQAYGELAVKMKTMIRAFKDLPYNVIFTAMQEKAETDVGTKFFPALPGQQLAGKVNWISHQFDEVFSYRILPDEAGGTNARRLLQTQPDAAFDAKDRSGSLEFWEEPNLANIFKKILEG
jgi:AAA domain